MSQHHRPSFGPSFRPNGSTQTSDSRPRRGQLPPYRIVLLQNANLDLMFVVRTVMEVTRFCRAEATHKMWLAHHSGRATLLITYKERAELYVEQFADRGLSVIIEPA